jgi:pimeloyl-ACP methyl ester carboxylesterase
MKCNLRNININYEIYGEGKPILMLHGYYPDHRLMSGCMEPIFNQISGWKRIYIDLPGMGMTPAHESIKNADDMLELVLEFIDTIIPEENFLIAGESYGAYLTRGIIYKRPEKVDGMFLLCPCIITDHSKRILPQYTVIVKDETLLEKLSPQEAEDFQPMAVVQTQEVWDRYRSEIYSGVSLADVNFLENFRNTGFSFSFEVDNLPQKFKKPSLILLGLQDTSVGYKDAWNILDNYSRCTLAVLDRAGHNLQIEQPELFNHFVAEWIRRVDEHRL